jgi:hypothetical protein
VKAVGAKNTASWLLPSFVREAQVPIIDQSLKYGQNLPNATNIDRLKASREMVVRLLG